MRTSHPSFRTLSEAYPRLIEDILSNGNPVSPRGMATKEICGVSFLLETIDDCVPLQKSRKLNYRFAVLEGLLNVHGSYPAELILKYNRNMERFMNPATGTWDGAYAPRIGACLKSVYELLARDPDTREAVIPIFATHDALAIGVSKDVPCTTTLQFLIRGGRLNTIATMRSNDILWGLSLDVNQFVTVTRALASWLGIQTGWYLHQAGSFHSYDEREEQLRTILEAEKNKTEEYADFCHPAWPNRSYDETKKILASLFDRLSIWVLTGTPVRNDFPPPFDYYCDILTGERKVTFSAMNV